MRFYSYMDCFRLLSLYYYKQTFGVIYYFDISKTARWLIDLLRMNNHIKPINFSLSEVRNEQGELYYIPILSRYLIDICNEIERDILLKNHFVSRTFHLFDKDSIVLYLKKNINYRLMEPVTQMVISAWYLRNKININETALHFSLEKNIFHAVLKKFAKKEFNLVVEEYMSWRSIFRDIKRLAGSFYRLMKLMIKSTTNDSLRNRHHDPNNAKSKIAALYAGWKLTFSRQQRSDLPWLLVSNIPRERALIYFERTDIPATDATVTEMRQNNVGLIALNSKAIKTKTISIYSPNWSVTLKLIKEVWKTLKALFISVLKGEVRSILFLEQMLQFITEYVISMDFYKAHNIKIIVDRFDLEPNRIPRHLALTDTGGVSISYQLSHWAFPAILTASTADIFFTFGNQYQNVLRESGTHNKYLVTTGYTNDYSFAPTLQKSILLRKQLLAAGAKFVVCYFDENSSDDRMSILTNSTAATIYNHLLSLVLKEHHIALICSPKRPDNLSKRLPGLTALILESQKTGRCVFMNSDRYTEGYPNEAAQASDIAISLLYSGTTALESYLSGTCSLFIDLEGCNSYPEYSNSNNGTIHKSTEDLINHVKKMADDSDYFNNFKANYIFHNIRDRDPFRDGKAAVRMGQYMGWLLEKIDNNETRESALSYANEQYGRTWGNDYIKKL